MVVPPVKDSPVFHKARNMENPRTGLISMDINALDEIALCFVV
jgi:hypothetical protein